MLPPERATRPSRFKRWTTRAVVVLLPLVPVMQATMAGSVSSMKSPSPPHTATPARSKLGHVGPVTADARTLDDDVAAKQCVEAI